MHRFGFLWIVNNLKVYQHVLKLLTVKCNLKLLTFYKHQMLGTGIENEDSFNDFFFEKSTDVN